MQESASQRNGKFLSETFTRVKDLHRWQCAKGHTFQMKPNTVRSGSWCPHCAGKVVTYNDMVQMAQRKGGKFVSQEYRGNAVKHDWECCEGHQWKMVPNAVQQGQWCPRCSKKLTERIVRVHFEQLFGKSFPTVKPKWLVNIRGNRMELDGYCETLNLAFEYHGFQHYQYKHFFHRTEKGFQDRKTNDVLKQKICKSKGVNLIEIPYTIQPDELKTFILSECKQLHILISSKQKGMKIDCRESYSSRDLERYQAIAARHGGVCLSPHYVNAHTKLWWQCKQGHQWLMKPNQIQQGCWCVKCKGLGIYKRPF